MTDDGPGACRVAGALFHAPQFLAGQRIISVMRLGAAADQDGSPAQSRHVGSGKGLAQVAFGLRLSVRSEVLEVNRAIDLPHRLAGAFVERDDKLVIAPVEIHDQQIAVENR